MPALVLQQPLRWLRAINDFNGTHSAAPNFAFDMCIKRISEKDKETLDLSRWQVCVNGAEPIRAESLEDFLDAFACCRLKPDVIKPGYGLAEATLKVTCAEVGRLPRIMELDNSAYEKGQVISFNQVIAGSKSRKVVGCGWSHIDADIRIVNPHSLKECAPNEIGEIWVSSTSIALGYWNNPQTSESVMQASLSSNSKRFLRTGDLGFVNDNELFVVGRLKDLIIIRGRNLYPQDIEYVVENCHSALRAGRSCAFSIKHEGAEALVIVAEIERTERHNFNAAEIFEKLTKKILTEFEVSVFDIVFVRTGTFALTSSGKPQRRFMHDAYLAKTLDIAAQMHSVPKQKARENYVQPWLHSQVAKLLRTSVEKISVHQSFQSLGMDSIALFEMIGTLEQFSGISIPPDSIFDYPDIASLSEYVSERTKYTELVA